jgi:calcineurin-like phosphoesterase family protein
VTVFFTADTHFGDHRVLNISKRPFSSVDEMDAAMTQRWNAIVGAEDEVWHLGDFARNGKIAAKIFPLLNGRKHLIVGNNDTPAVLNLNWMSVQSYAEITVDSAPLVLCHYPFRTWNGIGKGVINLHGHSHGRLKPIKRQLDVGVDVRDFRPVTFAALTNASHSGGS